MASVGLEAEQAKLRGPGIRRVIPEVTLTEATGRWR